MTVDRDRDVTKRMNWFDRQFLRAQDLADEQDFHRDRRARHNRLLHTPGVAEGLVVSGEAGDGSVTVSPGTAVDAAGRELVLLRAVTVALPGAPATAAELYLVYAEEASDLSTDPGLTGMPTRTVEAAQPVLRVTAGADPVPPVPASTASVPPDVVPPVTGVLLAALPLDGGGRLSGPPADDVRRAAGVALGGEAAFSAVTLQRQGRNAQAWPRLSAPRDGAIATSGDLDVGVNLTVGTGGDHSLRVSSGWTAFTDADGSRSHAEISNDTDQYQTLMIAGNRSADPNERRVSVWDALYVNGHHNVSGNATVSGGLSVTGQVSAAGGLATNGLSAGLPSGIGDGIHAHSVYADGGAVVAGAGDAIKASMDFVGNGFFMGDVTVLGALTSRAKQFTIAHPLDAQRKLVHGSLEGPEFGVYYRGEGRLSGGRATVELPSYFEALTLKEQRTVQLTPCFENGDETLHALAASRVVDGRFDVRTVDGAESDQAFYWQVTGVRGDVDPLAVEVDEPMPEGPPATAASGGDAAPAGSGAGA